MNPQQSPTDPTPPNSPPPEFSQPTFPSSPAVIPESPKKPSKKIMSMVYLLSLVGIIGTLLFIFTIGSRLVNDSGKETKNPLQGQEPLCNDQTIAGLCSELKAIPGVIKADLGHSWGFDSGHRYGGMFTAAPGTSEQEAYKILDQAYAALAKHEGSFDFTKSRGIWTFDLTADGATWAEQNPVRCYPQLGSKENRQKRYGREAGYSPPALNKEICDQYTYIE